MVKTFDYMQKTTNANVDEAMRSFEGATKVTQAIASQIADYSKRSFEHGTKTMENLLSAKSLDKAIEVQTEYAKAAYEGYVSHARKPGEKPKMHPPFEFGLARPSPITVIDQERTNIPANGTKISQGPHILAASVGKLPILGENGDHVPAHYMMHVNGIISIVDSAPLFRLEELMTQNDEWAAAVEYLSAGSITDFDNTGRRLKGMLIGVAHQPDHSVRLRKEKE